MKNMIEPLRQPDRIISYWKKEKLIVVCIVIFGLGYNISAILGPIYQGKLIDGLLRGDNLQALFMLALTYVLLIGTIQVMRYIKRFYIRRFANTTISTMRMMIYNNIIYKSYQDLGRENIGDLMTKALSDVDLCVEGMRKFTTEIFDTGVLMASYLTAMLFYDVKITILSAVFIPAAMLLAEKLKTIIYRYSIAFRAQSSMVADMTFDAVENIMLYRVTGMERQARDKYDLELEDLQHKAIQANILGNSMQPLYNAIAMLGVILVIQLGGNKVIEGSWTVGYFSAYMTMFAALAVKASKAAKLFNSVQISQISWLRIKPYLSDYQHKLVSEDYDHKNTQLILENLTFSYPDAKEAILENISLTAQAGEIIGVTGSVASGKSTLGLVLLGLYPYSGSIRIDGQELADYSEYERSQMISYLGHDAQLLSDSIYNNIALGQNLDVSSVLQDVGFEPDLEDMPNGINTTVGASGIRLSGGQQARIALARSLVRKNKIIILDDPFSAVDMKTEAIIIENLKKHYKDSLIIIISHRLAIFGQVDRIVLLQSDKRFSYGTHDQLMESSEIYSSIYKLQQLAGDVSE